MRALSLSLLLLLFSSFIWDVNHRNSLSLSPSLSKVKTHIDRANIRSRMNVVSLVIECNLFQIKAAYARYLLNGKHHHDDNDGKWRESMHGYFNSFPCFHKAAKLIFNLVFLWCFDKRFDLCSLVWPKKWGSDRVEAFSLPTASYWFNPDWKHVLMSTNASKLVLFIDERWALTESQLSSFLLVHSRETMSTAHMSLRWRRSMSCSRIIKRDRHGDSHSRKVSISEARK